MTATEEPSFGSLLRRLRREAELTQEELAERAGLSVRSIGNLEREGGHVPYQATVFQLAEALGLTPGDRAALLSASRRRRLGSPRPDVTEPREAVSLAAGAVHSFLIADVRGYTRFTEEHGDQAAARLAAQFAALVREIVSAHAGEVIELRGDEALAGFASARQVLRAAVSLQERCARETMAATTLPLQVGIGLDAGEAIPFEGGFRGAALNLAARLCALAGPGEVLASEGVIHLARKVEGLGYLERGAVQLKGFAEPVRVVQVVPEEAAQAMDAAGVEAGARRPLPIGGFLGALPAGPLVAREEEVRRVLGAAQAVAGGSGRLVFLVGEPGVGKTRLAQEVNLELRNRGFVVVSGRCYEPQEAVPFYPFLEAIEALYTAAPQATRAVLPQRWPYLGRLLPNAPLPVPPGSVEGREEQERLFWAVTGFVQAVTEQQPVALLLDDLHWADASSLALLQHLARHTRAYRVLLLGTYRDREAGRYRSLEVALRDLGREQLAARIAIRGLGPEETQALIATSFGEEEVSSEFAALIHRHTEGNPFFTQEVLHALVERGDIYPEDGHWERREIAELAVPESVRAAIGERLSWLRADAQELLQQASVLGQTFGFEDLQAMGDHPDEQLEAALEEAVAAGLVREAGRDQYSFNHALTQQALYAALSSRRKKRLHLAAGEALERLPSTARMERAAELAWHFREADDVERGLQYSLLAGDQAQSVFAHAEAEQHYRAALELAQERGETEIEAELLQKLGSTLSSVGRYDEALHALEQAGEIYGKARDLEAEGRIVAQIGHVHYDRGTPEEGILRLEEALGELSESRPSSAFAASYAALARLLMVAGRSSEQLEMAEKAADLARAVGDEQTFFGAEATRGAALLRLGRSEEALRTLGAMIPLAEAAGDLSNLGRALDNAGDAAFSLGNFDECRRYRERLLELAERRDDLEGTVFALVELSKDTFLTGDWSSAKAYLEKADGILRSISASRPSRGAISLLLTRVWLFLAEGELEAASRDLNECIATAERGGAWALWADAHSLLAEKDLLQGRSDAALARLEPLLDRPQAAEHLNLLTVTWAYLEQGDLVRAQYMMTRAMTQATVWQDRTWKGETMRVQGMVQSRQGEWAGAAHSFEEALSLARSMTMPYLEGRILYEWGRMYAAREAPQQAQERLEEALVIFRRLGARPYIERTEQALADSR